MPTPLYKKPFKLNNIFNGQDIDKQDVGGSISQYIELIIFTRYGEHRFKPDFGCEIWDLDFELIISESMWEEKLRQSLLRSITQYEKRIYDVHIDVHIEIKKKVEIVVSGKMQQTGENYVFTTSLFLSPLSA
jgi:phage baseplate assembly protein W